MYDIAIVGAGINGSSVAHEFVAEGKKVIIFDMESIANGGSGAAGAFISPKFSKSGELKELIHDAFVYSMDFYEKNFPAYFTKAPLLHIAQNEQDDEILKIYKQNTNLKLHSTSKRGERETISLDTGIVDAKQMCESLCNGATFVKEKVKSLEYDNGLWTINKTYSATTVVLATGAYESVISEPYIKLRGVWGHRIDIKTSTVNPHSIHQFVSISPSDKDNILAIGATHNVHYHPQTATQPYNIQEGREELLEKASRTIDLQDVEILKDYTGLRSGSFDYMPLVGALVVSKETLQDKTIKFYTKKPDFKSYTYYPHLYMINGNGGYGFVLAPYLAKILKDFILNATPISQRILPARFFARMAKKS